MKRLFAAVALLALVGTIAPSVLYLAGRMELDSMKNAMLVATVVWYVFAALWIYGGGKIDTALADDEHAPVVP
jgi:uncharacterized membrane protein